MSEQSIPTQIPYGARAVLPIGLLAISLATILAYLFLGEPIRKSLLWGGILVLLGIYLSAREERKLGKL